MPGFQELLVIAVVAFLVFGPERLPEMARTAGRLVGRLRSETRRNLDEFQELSEVRELRDELRSVRSELNEANTDLRRRLDPPAGAGRNARAPGRRPPSERRAPTAPRRVDGDPPPTDPEAT